MVLVNGDTMKRQVDSIITNCQQSLTLMQFILVLPHY